MTTVGLPSTRALPRWRPLVTVASIVLAGALLVGALLGSPVLLVVDAVVMACLVFGWVVMLGLPGFQGTTVVLAVGAVASMVGGSVFARDGLLWLSASVALVTLLAFVHQLARRDGRPRLVESISASVTGIVLLSSGASLLPLLAVPGGPASAVTVMAAVCAGGLGDLGGRWGWPLKVCALASVVLGAAAGAIATGIMPGHGLGPVLAALVGGLAGGASHAVRQVQAVLPQIGSPRAQLASAAASVLSVGLFTHVATVLVTHVAW